MYGRTRRYGEYCAGPGSLGFTGGTPVRVGCGGPGRDKGFLVCTACGEIPSIGSFRAEGVNYVMIDEISDGLMVLQARIESCRKVLCNWPQVAGSQIFLRELPACTSVGAE